MLTKDWIYIGLIAFTAITFYVHGYYRGKSESPPKKSRVPSVIGNLDFPVTGTVLSRGSKSIICRQTPEGTEIVDSVHCFFGNN